MESGDLLSLDVTDYYTAGISHDTIMADLCPECSKSKLEDERVLDNRRLSGGDNDLFNC